MTRPVAGSTVTSPEHDGQPPLVGPPDGSRARFHFTSQDAPFRIPWTISVWASKRRSREKSADQLPPLHSLTATGTPGCRARSLRSADTSPL